jgi:tellurite resistance protein TerC
MSPVSPWAWAGFLAFVATMLILDLAVFHRKAHVIKLPEAAKLSAMWVSLAMLFNVLVLFWRGPASALEFFTGYLLEESLSVDNLFIFLVIFNYFALPLTLYHYALVWGILGAVVLRGTMILAGSALISAFHWVLYIFGALLIFTAVKLAFQSEGRMDPGRNFLVRLIRYFFPVSSRYAGTRFTVRKRDGTRAITPLLIVIIALESTDVLFAIDSIPAIFAITRDPFIVFTSNIFAILGLRAIFFLIVGIIHRFQYLRYGLAIVLAFIGVKMLLENWLHVPVYVSLAAITVILGGSILLSPAQKSRGQRATRDLS